MYYKIKIKFIYKIGILSNFKVYTFGQMKIYNALPFYKHSIYFGIIEKSKYSRSVMLLFFFFTVN